MNNCLTLASLLVAIAAAGCASSVPAPRSASVRDAAESDVQIASIPLAAQPDCSTSAINTKDCTIRLKVTPQGTSCEIDFVLQNGNPNPDADLVAMAKPAAPSPPLTIYWLITTSGYIFTRDGIAFVDNVRPRAFDEGFRQDSDKNIFQWTNLNPKRHVHGYVISVRTPGSPITSSCEKDPWIRNR